MARRVKHYFGEIARKSFPFYSNTVAADYLVKSAMTFYVDENLSYTGFTQH